jgi:outer membrane protein
MRKKGCKRYSLIALFSLWITVPQAADLLTAYRDALQNDPIFHGAQAEFLATREQLPQSLSRFFPNVASVFSTTGNKMTTTGEAYYFNERILGLTVNQTILNFSYLSQVSAASLKNKQAAVLLHVQAQDLILRLAKAYFAVLEAQDMLHFTQQQKQALYQQYAQSKQRYQVGSDPIDAMYAAEAKYDAMISAEIQARNAVENSKQSLMAITGFVYNHLAGLAHEFPLVTPNPNHVEVWLNLAHSHNLAYLAARFASFAAQATVHSAWSGHLPTLSATGSRVQDLIGEHNGLFKSNALTQSVSLQLSVPLFSGGATQSTVRQSQYQLQQALSNQELAYRNAQVTTEQQFNNVRAELSAIRADRQAVLSSQTALSSMQDAYRVGKSTMVDVLTAEANVFQARQTLAHDQYQYLLAVLSLKAAIGMLSERDVILMNRWLKHTA